MVMGWLSTMKRRIKLLAKQVFKVLKDGRPFYLQNDKFNAYRAETRDGLRMTELSITHNSEFTNSFIYQRMSV